MTNTDRITRHPDVMGGQACIRGMRVTVGMIIGQIGAGHSIDDLLADYPYLERDDIVQALRYTAQRESPLPLRVRNKKARGQGSATPLAGAGGSPPKKVTRNATAPKGTAP